MKKSVYLFLIMMCVLTAGCGGEQTSTDTGRTTETGNVDSQTEQQENVMDTEDTASETKYITINLSDAKETHAEGEAVTPLNWNVESEEYNGSDSADEWYDSKNLSLPMIGYNWDNFYDDNYQ